MNKKITLIGGGRLSSALIAGFIAGGVDASHIMVSARSQSTLSRLSQEFGVCVAKDNDTAIANTDIVILAVKPAQLEDVCIELATKLTHSQLIISVAAGVETKSLRQWLGGHSLVLRAMPNLAASIGQSATALFADKLSLDAQSLIDQLFGLLGSNLWLTDEGHMAVVTSIAGSGPAYYYLLSESMIKAAEALGLPKSIATNLCKQTALGAAMLVMPEQSDITVMRDQVTSPGGTTAAAVNTMIDSGWQDIVERAIEAAYRRASQMKTS